MQGQSLISTDVLALYAADAAREVRGVHALVGRHEGVRVARDDGRVTVELHLALAHGASAPEVGAAVQSRVAQSLDRLADVRPASVDVVVSEWHRASPA